MGTRATARVAPTKYRRSTTHVQKARPQKINDTNTCEDYTRRRRAPCGCPKMRHPNNRRRHAKLCMTNIIDNKFNHQGITELEKLTTHSRATPFGNHSPIKNSSIYWDFFVLPLPFVNSIHHSHHPIKKDDRFRHKKHTTCIKAPPVKLRRFTSKCYTEQPQ